MSRGLDNLIKNSSSLLMSRGYNNTSMTDIGNSCGLNKGSIYHYFTSKEELVVAVVDNLSDYFDRLVFSFAYDHSKTEKKRLSLMLKNISEYFNSTKGCLMWQLASELTYTNLRITKKINEFFDLWVDSFSHLFESQYTKKKARELSVDSIIEIEGAVIWLRIKNDPQPLKRALNRLKVYIE